ncbi:hypothetical protein [Thalassotalea sp. PLHSN55]|uniref:hypothetical protein n=1 Tax=Thalassotalea sp. PLHSN55 TaxID=3435888 RepID=UPI003F86BFB5
MKKACANLLTLTTFSLIFSAGAVADGLTDLQSALTKLTGTVPVSAELESAFTRHSGKAKKLKTTSGFVQVALTDNANGLQINYSNQTINAIEQEANAKENDEEVNTPTLNALDGIQASNLRNMLSAANDVARTLKKAEFISEQPTTTPDGKLARLLNFTLPLEAIVDNKEVRGYVDDFTGNYSVTIDENGVPLSAQLSFEGSGRAYIIFSLDIAQTNTAQYQVVGDRLIKVHEEFDRKQNSTFGKRDSSGYKTLTLKPDESLVAFQP